ncbi:hypothetical protein DL767_008001 [Monosporascus sp. MG133]|nr:hypothetical protein DL767_008001 [Monosporascus sp. MG133]
MVDAEETKANQAYQKQYQRQTLKFRYYRDRAVAPDAWRLLGETKRWFGGPPKFDYQKCLGYGGMGLALHYKYSNPGVGGGSEDGDCVLKVSLEGGKNKNTRDEIRATQMIDPPSVGRPARVLPQEELPSDDLSIPAQSSADEAEYKEPPQRMRRKDMTPYDRAGKLNTHRARQRRRKLAIRAQETRLKAEAEARERKRSLRTRGKGKEPALPDDEDADADPGDEAHDYILLEYMKNGDMANMLYRLNEQDEKVPNRVLWSFFLCLIRGCIGMAWYPRRFHPQRGNSPDQDLIEQLPAEGSVQERCMKQMVHFDIDPKNNIDPSEHDPMIAAWVNKLVYNADENGNAGPAGPAGAEAGAAGPAAEEGGDNHSSDIYN